MSARRGDCAAHLGQNSGAHGEGGENGETHDGQRRLDREVIEARETRSEGSKRDGATSPWPNRARHVLTEAPAAGGTSVSTRRHDFASVSAGDDRAEEISEIGPAELRRR